MHLNKTQNRAHVKNQTQRRHVAFPSMTSSVSWVMRYSYIHSCILHTIHTTITLQVYNILHISCIRTVTMSGYFLLTLITLAPVYANMIQILLHTYRGLGCSIFVEINVKKQSNPSPFKVFNILHCSAHMQPSTISSTYHFKKRVPFRHKSRGNQGFEEYHNVYWKQNVQ